MTVDFIYDADCPNVGDARANLRSALATAKCEVNWTEWERSAPQTPPAFRLFGSPTVLIDGHDVGGERPAASGGCCRLYSQTNGTRTGTPAADLILRVLLDSNRNQPVPPERRIPTALHQWGPK